MRQLILQYLVPAFALLVSIIALIINRHLAAKNLRTSILQMILKTLNEKAKDTNRIWFENSKPGQVNIKLVSEVIMTKELIISQLKVFNDKRLLAMDKTYYDIYWKQLDTGIRNFFMNPPAASINFNDEIYSKQLEEIRATFINI